MERNGNQNPLFWEETQNLHEEIQELNEALERERDQRKEERFVWIIASVILIDIFVFSSMESFMGPLIIGVFEAVALLLVARKMGLEEVVKFINKLIAMVSGSTKNE